MGRKAIFLMVGLFLVSFVLFTPAKETKKEKAKTEQIKISKEFMNNVWKKVSRITEEKKSFTVEKATTVAGVRGKEAQDEALTKLYFKGGENYPSRLEIKQAVKVLKAKLNEKNLKQDEAEIRYYIAQCQAQLGDKEAALKTYDEIITKSPNSKWAKLAKEGKKQLGG